MNSTERKGRQCICTTEWWLVKCTSVTQAPPAQTLLAFLSAHHLLSLSHHPAHCELIRFPGTGPPLCTAAQFPRPKQINPRLPLVTSSVFGYSKGAEGSGHSSKVAERCGLPGPDCVWLGETFSGLLSKHSWAPRQREGQCL